MKEPKEQIGAQIRAALMLGFLALSSSVFVGVLVSAGIELTVFLAAGTVPCFEFSM